MNSSSRFFAVHPSRLKKGIFLDRPNRFLVRCMVEGKSVEAFLPNPGRLEAILLPDTPIFLSREETPSLRRTEYTVWGAEYRGRPVLLHTHFANSVVERLLRKGLIPGLEEWDIERREAAVGHSRFDFLLRRNQELLYLEVKSTSQFGEKMAMFPDSPTTRGKKHVEELGNLAEQGHRTAVLFLVHSPVPRLFLPSWHLDPAFAEALHAFRDRLQIIPLGVEWKEDFSLGGTAALLDLPWEIYERERRDKGNYLLFSQDGERSWRVLTGYADPLESFLRKAKKGRLSSLSPVSPLQAAWEGMPIRTSRDDEKLIRRRLSLLADEQKNERGESYFSLPLSPKKIRAFSELVLWLRSDRLAALAD